MPRNPLRSDTKMATLIDVVGIDGTKVKITPLMACNLIYDIPNLRVLGLTLDEIRIAKKFYSENVNQIEMAKASNKTHEAGDD